MAVNAKPIFLWDNELARSTATLTASASATGHPVINLCDWRTYIYWQGSGAGPLTIKLDAGAPVAVDSWAVAGHDLFTQGASIKLQRSSDDITYTDVVASFAPSTNLPFAKFFDSLTYRYWMTTIAAGYSAAPKIGAMFLGLKMQMPCWTRRPFNPDPIEIIEAEGRSRDGQHLETIERYRHREMDLAFGSMTNAWFEANVLNFWNNHVPKRFFWIWDATNHPTAVHVMRVTKPKLDAPLGPNRREWNVTIQGVNG